ncbi:bacillithiol system redox-active protein YtxJ [Ohtaekwangia sp.]|uniref:bacillithiol system redox-active protein YtxJ n=1 Tax=Ohtaekwangia sp. TaxID=2066019 RepID=UPI002F95AF9A
MNWSTLNTLTQLEQIKEESKANPVVIFKHSTRCSISRTVLDRLERNWKHEDLGHVKAYYLDLISYREVSNQIAEQFEIEHESPQVLIISQGKAVYDQSHLGIDYNQLRQELKN